jgi:hypothetical protein
MAAWRWCNGRAQAAEMRGISVSDLLITYAEEGLRRDATTE